MTTMKNLKKKIKAKMRRKWTKADKVDIVTNAHHDE